MAWLIANCPEAMPAKIDDTVDQPCALVRDRGRVFAVRAYDTSALRPVLIVGAMTALVGATVATAVCAGECHAGPVKTAAEIAAEVRSGRRASIGPGRALRIEARAPGRRPRGPHPWRTGGRRIRRRSRMRPSRACAARATSAG
jgi:hypothetical protein